MTCSYKYRGFPHASLITKTLTRAISPIPTLHQFTLYGRKPLCYRNALYRSRNIPAPVLTHLIPLPEANIHPFSRYLIPFSMSALLKETYSPKTIQNSRKGLIIAPLKLILSLNTTPKCYGLGNSGQSSGGKGCCQELRANFKEVRGKNMEKQEFQTLYGKK